MMRGGDEDASLCMPCEYQMQNGVILHDALLQPSKCRYAFPASDRLMWGEVNTIYYYAKRCYVLPVYSSLSRHRWQNIGFEVCEDAIVKAY